MTQLKKRTVALIVLLAFALCSLCACSQSKEVKFGTGNSEGMYYQFGSLLADESQN